MGLDALPARFASATSSLTEFAGTLGCSDRTSGVEEIQLIGVRSLWMLNFICFAFNVAITEMLPDVNRMVLPSGGASTVSCVAINPLAPVRLSMMKFCPMLFWNATESTRAWMSVPPPGGNGTRMRTDLSGHCCAETGRTQPIHAALMAATTAAFFM